MDLHKEMKNTTNGINEGKIRCSFLIAFKDHWLPKV